jgi:hypothetical protein
MMVMLDPAVGLPTIAAALADKVAIYPDMVTTAVGPVSRGPDVSRTCRRGDDDSRLRWSDSDIDPGRMSQ